MYILDVLWRFVNVVAIVRAILQLQETSYRHTALFVCVLVRPCECVNWRLYVSCKHVSVVIRDLWSYKPDMLVKGSTIGVSTTGL